MAAQTGTKTRGLNSLSHARVCRMAFMVFEQRGLSSYMRCARSGGTPVQMDRHRSTLLGRGTRLSMPVECSQTCAEVNFSGIGMLMVALPAAGLTVQSSTSARMLQKPASRSPRSPTKEGFTGSWPAAVRSIAHMCSGRRHGTTPVSTRRTPNRRRNGSCSSQGALLLNKKPIVVEVVTHLPNSAQRHSLPAVGARRAGNLLSSG